MALFIIGVIYMMRATSSTRSTNVSGSTELVVRQMIFSSLQRYAFSPTALYQSAKSPPSDWTTFNKCLKTCVQGGGVVAANSSCQAGSQVCESLDGADAALCPALPLVNGHKYCWYPFTLYHPNPGPASLPVAGGQPAGSTHALVRYDSKGKICPDSVSDTSCPFVARAFFHPICPTASAGGALNCNKAYSIQVRVQVGWNPNYPAQNHFASNSTLDSIAPPGGAAIVPEDVYPENPPVARVAVICPQGTPSCP